MHSLRKLLPYLRPYRWYMLVVILASAGITAMNLVNPWLVRELVQMVRIGQIDTGMDRVITMAALLVGIFHPPRHLPLLVRPFSIMLSYNFVSDLRVRGALRPFAAPLRPGFSPSGRQANCSSA
ncbi:MAG: hypothetical protein U0528_05035 [Anaerolineae bacterium]